MNPPWRFLIPLALFLGGTSTPFRADFLPTPGPTIGVVDGGKLLAVGRRPEKQDMLFLLAEPLRLEPRNRSVRMAYDISNTMPHPTFLRWRVRHDCFWSAAAREPPFWCIRIPKDEWQYFDEEKSAWGCEQLRKIYKVTGNVHGFNFTPVGELWQKLLPPFNPLPVPTKPFFVDFVPTGPTAVTLFTLLDGQMTVWEGRASFGHDPFRPDAPQAQPYWRATWKEGETFAAGFNESYLAIGQREDLFFLTQTGRLYWTGKPLDGRARKCRPIWTDGERPVSALITDTSSDRTFLFCTEKGAAASTYQAYFELSPRPTPLPVRRGAIPVPPREANPLELVRPLAQFLVEQEHIPVR